jgi:hypothetical protein
MLESHQRFTLSGLPEELIIQIITHIFSGPCILDLDISQPPHTIARRSVSILSTSRRLHWLGKQALRKNFTLSGLHVCTITPRPKEPGEDKLLSFLRQYGDCFREVLIAGAAARDDTFSKRLLCFPNLERLTLTGEELEIQHILDPGDEVCASGMLSLMRVREIFGANTMTAVMLMRCRFAQLEKWGLKEATQPRLEGWWIEGLERRKGNFSIALEVVLSISAIEVIRWRAVGRWVSLCWWACAVGVG